jgi:TPP-dependent pyruvate/acetoin dehydrogenase alpha subunit
VSPLDRTEELQAEVSHYRDSVALLRARLYRRGMATSPRLEELEHKLETAQRRLRAARTTGSR